MAPHITSHRAACLCFMKKVSLQLSSEQSVGDVRITQLDWKRVPLARSRGCKSSVAITTECSRHHASRNVSWPQRAVATVAVVLNTCIATGLFTLEFANSSSCDVNEV